MLNDGELMVNAWTTFKFDFGFPNRSCSIRPGPYKLVFKQTYSANPAKNYKLKYNFYFSHKDNKTTLFGNTTMHVPFDDTLFLEVKIAMKDAYGSWKENSLMHKWQNACSTLKQFAGNIWTASLYGLGINHTNCPLPTGFYIAPGIDILQY
ncbi:uncharacterized protein LOC132918085 isoform X2 [Rhopalosiphum padi]|uniref:uncharacterized protein LOC132918085 isoform X2 n=1 Tax=Rhopalosiphum padi TaxID=40932 RepID=UPI00298EA3B7|nr:uncharacterized protein LOC132918085 isoform X2 [Rhopalosiphum padi]